MDTRLRDLASFLEGLPEWSSSDRRSFLFAELPEDPSEQDTTAFSASVRFWTHAITNATQRRLLGPSALAFGSNGLHLQLQHNGAAPLCIDVVLDHLVRTGAIVPDQDRPTFAGWLLEAFVLSPIKWTLGSSHAPLTQTRRTFIVCALVDAAADALMRHHAQTALDSVANLMDLPLFMAKCTESRAFEAPVDKEDAIRLLRHLRNTNMATFETHTNVHGNVVYNIKLKPQTAKPVGALTDTDRGIITIKRTMAMLEMQVSEMETRVVGLTRTAQQRLADKMRDKAMAAVKQRKSIQAVCDQRIASLETLGAILSKIQSSETEAQVLEAYETGTSALKTFMDKHKMSVDRVDEVMDNLQETLTDYTDIEQAIVQGQTTIVNEHGVIVDEDALEKELDALVEQERVEDVLKQMEGLSVSTQPLPHVEPVQQQQISSGSGAAHVHDAERVVAVNMQDAVLVTVDHQDAQPTTHKKLKSSDPDTEKQAVLA